MSQLGVLGMPDDCFYIKSKVSSRCFDAHMVRLPIQTTVAVVMPLFSNYRQLLRYYIISYDVAGVFNVTLMLLRQVMWRFRGSKIVYIFPSLGLGSRGFQLVARAQVGK